MSNIYFNSKINELRLAPQKYNFSSKLEGGVFLEDSEKFSTYSEKLFISYLYINNFFDDLSVRKIFINSVSIQIDILFSEEIKIKNLKKKIKNFQESSLKFPEEISNKFDISFKDWKENIKPEKLIFSHFHPDVYKEYELTNFSTYEDKKNDTWIRLEIKKKKEIVLHGDHRLINKEQNFFWFSERAGAGFPFWLPNGIIVKEEIKKMIKQKEKAAGFYFVTSPILGSKSLYEQSGHFDHYHDYIFPEVKLENLSYILRPMTCPHHCLIFGSKKRTHKDLPIGISENSLLFRQESSGALTGFERTRQMELKDTHIFVENKEKKIKDQIKKTLTMTIEVLNKLEIKVKNIYLSLQDPTNKKKYFDDPRLWKETETIMAEVLKEEKIEYIAVRGEAAFYGPKIDFQIDNAQNKDVTLATIQLDFLLGKRFNLSYETLDKKIDTPIIIHHGIIGTYERLLSILVEKKNGWLPFWLSPVQVAIFELEENNEGKKFIKKISEKLESEDFRFQIFDFQSNITTNIKKAYTAKMPIQVFIGKKELENNLVSFKDVNSKNSLQMTKSVDEFVAFLKNL